MSKHIVVVVQDAGPGNDAKVVIPMLEKAEHRVTSFLGGGTPFSEGVMPGITQALETADVLYVSFSSIADRAREERHAFAEAKRLGVRVVVIPDIYGFYNRPWCADRLPHADTLVILEESETGSARRQVGPNPAIVAIPNPSWAAYFEPAADTRKVRATLGVQSDERMVLVIGSKEPMRNAALFTDVVVASNELDRLNLVLTMHPGAPFGKEIYADALVWSKHPTTLYGKGDSTLSSQQMLEGADLVIVPGGSTLGVAAACRRKPVIDFLHPIDKMWWESISGLNVWPPAQRGASCQAECVEDLVGAMRVLLRPLAPNSSNSLGLRQREIFPDGGFEAAAAGRVALLTA